MRYFTNRLLVPILLSLCVEMLCVSTVRADGNRSAERKEANADRKFLRQEFDKAMSLYEKAISEATSKEVLASLHAKTARLYYLQRNYAKAAEHFSDAMLLQERSLGTDDVCDYIDALRLQGLSKQAEEVCLRYAYQDAYSSNQRYLNMLDALSRHQMQFSGAEYEVLSEATCNTAAAEYWIGNIKDQPIYARSDNRFNDSGKRFYYDTKFFAIFGGSNRSFAHSNSKESIAPFAEFANGLRIRTVVESNSTGKIGLRDGRLNSCQTKLSIFGRTDRKGRDAGLIRLFPQQEGYSYCHPFLFDEDRVLLFASDAPGGYGGYDLYMMHWDDEMQLWGAPENLGPEINTGGDEISPTYYEGHIYFASNGQAGLGGYDIYSYEYDDLEGVLIPGSLGHLPASVNSVYNDFCLLPMDETWGYFVSDRNIATGDDIYSYRRLDGAAGSRKGYYGLSEMDAILGGRMLLSGMLEKTPQHKSQQVRFPAYTPKDRVLTLYFDFNSADLNTAALERLERFVRAEREYDIINFRILGYADEMGSEEYNRMLSLQRGQAVADALKQWFDLPIEIKGLGRTPLTLEQRNAMKDQMIAPMLPVDRELGNPIPSLSYIDRIRMNQPARRVDIYVNE